MPANTETYERTEYHREITGKRFRTHGLSGSPTHRSWIAMLSRCRNPNRKCFKIYGGRGITICDRWLKFENFIRDMGERPSSTSLERIDTNGNYEPRNCCWKTNQEQCRNKNNNHVVTVNGFTGCLKEVCEHFGVSSKYHSIKTRINRLKWPPEKAVLTIIRPRR